LIKVFVTAANLNDREGLFGILDHWKNPRRKLKVIWVDGGYDGAYAQDYARSYGIDLQLVKRVD
jgi:hypothetical protein